MRRTVSLLGLSLIMAFMLAMTQQAHAQLGIAAGANFDQLTDLPNREATFDNVSGYHVGIFYDLKLGALAIRPGVFYMDVGSFDVQGDDVLVDQVDFNLFEVPVDLRLRIFAAPLVRPYLMAGPTLRIARTDNEEFEDSINNLSVAGNAGIGVELGVPGTGMRFYPEFRYAFGLTRFADDVDFLFPDDVQFQGEDTFRLNTFMLRLGITF